MVLPKSHQAPLHHKNKRSLIQRLLDRTTSVFVGFKSQLKLLLCGVFQRLWTLDSSNLILFLTEITGYQRFAVLRVLRQRNVREKILREWPVSTRTVDVCCPHFFLSLRGYPEHVVLWGCRQKKRRNGGQCRFEQTPSTFASHFAVNCEKPDPQAACS